MTKVNQTLTLVKGDDHEITFAITDSDDAVKTMTAATSIKWEAVQVGSTAAAIAKTLSDGVTLVNVNGIDDGIKVTLSATDTNITAGTYRHELECVIGSKRSTLATGMLLIREDLINN
jgi:hypothetical protein